MTTCFPPDRILKVECVLQVIVKNRDFVQTAAAAMLVTAESFEGRADAKDEITVRHGKSGETGVDENKA